MKIFQSELHQSANFIFGLKVSKVFISVRPCSWQKFQTEITPEQKDKFDKAKKKYAKAQKLLIQSNKKFPNKADTLNYLGFTTRKLGDYENGEKYYLQGLEIEPNHIGINEYLGELYVATNRLNLAKERLKILENCNCEEYTELKQIIDGTKKSKY